MCRTMPWQHALAVRTSKAEGQQGLCLRVKKRGGERIGGGAAKARREKTLRIVSEGE